jgi:signal transduction histidine kinase
MLNLASNFQLVGAVFVESSSPMASRFDADLTPSMDREGFLANKGYEDLCTIVRTGLEFLANEDKKRSLALLQKKAKEAARNVREDFKAAIEFIQTSPTLTEPDKARLTTEYSQIAKRIEEVEDYDREARAKLEIMSSLGVVAGFMTHEATRIVDSLKQTVTILRDLSQKYPSLKKSLAEIEESYNIFKGQVNYTGLFIDSLQNTVVSTFRSAPQVRRVIERFGSFAAQREIDVKSEISADVTVPAMPIAAYSGILLNLYTNAIKAVVAAKSSKIKPRIVFRGWSDRRTHVVEVLDTGVGIPPNLRARIWDPLFTTTSRLNNPLGSGMGLGLSLVKQLVNQMKGKVSIVNAPTGFSTCFRVEFPMEGKP